jgi:hypothetical protein
LTWVSAIALPAGVDLIRCSGYGGRPTNQPCPINEGKEDIVSRKYRPRWPSHATVVAYLALFVTLGGSAYAVGTGGTEDGPRARAASESSVIGRFNNGPVSTTNTPTTLLSVPLKAGRYVILAKAILPNDARVVECRVSAGADFDRARLHNNGGLSQEAFTLTVLHRSDTPFTARLGCWDNDPTTAWNMTDLKLTAIRVNYFSNSPG